MGMFSLPEPPPDAGLNCLAFYVELRQMLDRTRPSKVSESKSSVKFSKQTLEVWLVHSENDDWSVGATMSESGAIVSTGPAHEHFSVEENVDPDRPWTTRMVDFIAEALRGEIETQTVFRGSNPITVEHFRIEADGSSSSLGFTGFLTPARAMVWLPKSSKIECHSFV